MRLRPEYEALAVEGSELSAAFELLCAHFDEELVRQRAVLDSCRAQGEAARAHVVPAFGLNRMVMRIESLYEELIEEKRLDA